jgi:hypothetical protein
MQLCQQGLKRMAVGILLQVACNLRVAELLQLTVGQIVAPTTQGVPHWSLSLFPVECGDMSKTGQVEEGVTLDCPEIQFLVPILKELRAMPPDTLIVGMTYLEFLAAFRSATNELRIALVPSQARHSGASMDLAYNRRSQNEVQRMGRWLATKSVRRYEKRNRLNISWTSFEISQQEHFLECQQSAANVFLRTSDGEALAAK